MDSVASKRTLRSSNRLSLTLSGRKPSGRRKRESTEYPPKCDPSVAEVCDDKSQIPLTPVRVEQQADVSETIIILSDDENDSQTPSKSCSIREYFTPSKREARPLSPFAGRPSVWTTGGKHIATGIYKRCVAG